jgi:hypothetical protein
MAGGFQVLSQPDPEFMVNRQAVPTSPFDPKIHHPVAPVFKEVADVTFKSFQKAAIAQGYPLSQIAHLRYYAEEVRKGTYATVAPTNHVRLVTGKDPEGFESVTRRCVQHPELVYHSLRIGSKWEAYRFLLKMLVTSPVDFDAWERDRGHPLLTNPELAHDSAEWRASAGRHQLNLLPLGTDEPSISLG